MTYENEYYSDGEIGPFLDAVEGEREWYEVDEDGDFPAGICDGSDSGAVASAIIAKGAKKSFSDDGLLPLIEKIRYQRMRSGMS